MNAEDQEGLRIDATEERRGEEGEEAIIDALLAQSEMAATPLLATPFDEGKFWHPLCS